MKKMSFTAIALVAFTGTSMANTIEDQKTELKISTTEKNSVINNKETKSIPTIDICAIAAIASYLEHEALGFHYTTCQSEAQGTYDACTKGQ